MFALPNTMQEAIRTMGNPNFPSEYGALRTILRRRSTEQRMGKAYEHPRQMVATACQLSPLLWSSSLLHYSPPVKALKAAALPR
jgi:hypothetical protein